MPVHELRFLKAAVAYVTGAVSTRKRGFVMDSDRV